MEPKAQPPVEDPATPAPQEIPPQLPMKVEDDHTYSSHGYADKPFSGESDLLHVGYISVTIGLILICIGVLSFVTIRRRKKK